MKKLFILILLFITFNSNAQERPKFTGLIIDSITYRKSVKSKLQPGRYTFPEKFSLLKYAPPIQNQGWMGTCVGWSMSYCAASTALRLERGTYIPYSPYCLYNRLKWESDKYCQAGLFMYDAISFLAERGVRKWKNYHNKCLQDDSYEYYENKFDFETLNISVNDFKKSISEYHPIPFSMPFFEDTMSNGSLNDQYINEEGLWTFKYSTEFARNGGHAMCIIAYDDNKFGGAFLVQNSWGEDWGKDGYFWLPYSEITEHDYDTGRGNIFDAYSVKIDPNYKESEDVYVWDFGPNLPEDYPNPYRDDYYDDLPEDLLDDDDLEDFNDEDDYEYMEDEFSVINNTDVSLWISIAYETYDGWISEGWWPCYEGEVSSIDVSSRISDEIYYRIEDATADLVWSGDASRSFCTSNEAFLYLEDKPLCARKRKFGLFENGSGTLSVEMNAATSRDLNAPKYLVSKVKLNPNRDPIINNLNWTGEYSLVDPVNNHIIIGDPNSDIEQSVWIVNNKNKAKLFIGTIEEIKELKQFKFSCEKTANVHIAFSEQTKKK